MGQTTNTEQGTLTSDYYYDLPEELIAQTPADQRDHSRLLVMHRKDGSLEHRIFYEVTEYLKPGDVIVVNESLVIPARLYGVREATGAKIEILFLKRTESDCWETLVKPGRRVKIGEWLDFGNGKLRAQVLSEMEGGVRVMRFFYEGEFYALLDELGEMPLPPYIHQKPTDPSRYQTVYAKQRGSAAAPTAGLHFTNELLRELEQRGVKIVKVLLHVGLGTFRPVQVDDIRSHHMHQEYFELTEDAAEAINGAKKDGHRVFAVGTTSVRVLESCAQEDGKVAAQTGWTGIFIYPGVPFRVVDALITNFHLPESTLLMLVSAFSDRRMILDTYGTAVAMKYRFFSFGDAMLILD